MLVSSLLTQVRYRINDTGVDAEQTKSDAELLGYYNEAVKFLSDLLIAKNDPEMVEEATIANGAEVPVNFVRFAGAQPVYITGGTFILYEAGPITVRYFASKGLAATVGSTVSFKDSYAGFLVQAIALYALNSDEYTLTQDLKILEASLGALTGAMV